jgi:hypothetical protein
LIVPSSFFTGQKQQTGSCDYDEAPQGDEYDEWMMGK